MDLNYKIRNDETLNKIVFALEKMKRDKQTETQISFTFSELLSIKKEIIMAHINTELCAENLREGIDFRKSMKD